MDHCRRGRFRVAFRRIDRGQTELTREGVIDHERGRTWFRVHGDLDEVPLLVLHGGPGLPHDYLSPLAQLDRPVVFYDQLGCGRSSRFSGEMSLDYFVDEISIVREYLNLDEVHLFGHSWGGWLALEHALRGAKLNSLVLASTYASVPRGMREVDRLVRNLAWWRRRSPERANKEFLKRHVCRLDPWPDALASAWKRAGEDVYRTMWGDSELRCDGLMRNWDVTNRLPALSVPVLVTCGRYDEVTPEVVNEMHQQIAGSELRIFEHSAHMPHLEEPDEYLGILDSFLRRLRSS